MGSTLIYLKFIQIFGGQIPGEPFKKHHMDVAAAFQGFWRTVSWGLVDPLPKNKNRLFGDIRRSVTEQRDERRIVGKVNSKMSMSCPLLVIMELQLVQHYLYNGILKTKEFCPP